MSPLSLFSAPGTFYRGNLHTHSTLSDGALEPQQVINAYKNAGYDFMCLSDHFWGKFDWPVADTHNLRSNGFTTIIGAELHAPKTSVGELWHILANGLPLDFAPCADDEDAIALARRAADTGAFVTIAHPAWSQLTIEDGRALMGIAHAVETYNHGCAAENDRADGFYLFDQLLSEGNRLTSIATDDAHFRDHDFDAFGGWVHVKAESLEPDAVLAALKAGDFYSSTGPQIYAVEAEGREITIECSPVDAISINGGTSRTVSHTGRNLTRMTLDLAKLNNDWHTCPPSKWLRIIIRDKYGKSAWTNPIWLADEGLA
jgi:hypothetical protein